MSVRLGSHYQTTGGEIREIEKIYNHPSYSSSTSANDISLIKLKTPIVYTKEMAPVCLIDKDVPNDDIAGKTAIVTGFDVFFQTLLIFY